MAVQFGKYVLDRWIAQGGMANIFTATYTGPLGFEREMVLKVILPDYAHHEAFIEMFLDEARLAARLYHPNIVQVLDLGNVGDYLYIAMEYVHGPSLSRAVARAKKEGRMMSPGLAVFIVLELLEALAYAHQRTDRAGNPLGIVHRDVNPQNILLSFDGQVKLTDFGVAKANVNLHESQAGVIKGKYSHMAPEQCLTKPVDGRADLFSVAIVLHELLTGKPLFHRPTAYEMMKAVVEEPVPPPSAINPKCPPELDGIVLRGLAKDPDKRYQTAMAFLDSLNLVAKRLQIVEGKHDLRQFLASIYHRSRLNLARKEEIGVRVTEDRISEILKGLSQTLRKNGSEGGVLSNFSRPRARSEPTTASLTGRVPDWPPEAAVEEDGDQAGKPLEKGEDISRWLETIDTNDDER